MWITSDGYGSSMRWHIALEESVETWTDMVWDYKTKTYSKPDEKIRGMTVHGDWLGDAKTKDAINILQSNVCSYCRQDALKQMGKEGKLIW